MKSVYTLKDADVFVKDLRGEMLKAAKKGLLSAAVRTVAHIQAQSDIPFDRGLYRQGWRAKPTAEGAVVENLAPHASFIEHGVRAANVRISRSMIEALASWVRRKGIGGTLVKGKKGTSFRKPSNAVATSIAWAIAKSMQKNGIFNKGAGLHILKKALEGYAKEFIRQEVERELEKV